MAPVVNAIPATISIQPQRAHQQSNQQKNQEPKKDPFDPIPMSYTELFLALIQKNLVQTRAPPQYPNGFPWWYKANATCAFHQGAPGHDIENCYPLKSEV